MDRNQLRDGSCSARLRRMYNEEKMNKALRSFDWPAVLALLPEHTLQNFRELLADVSRSGCLLRLYPLTQKEDELRANMIHELKSLGAQLGGAQLTKVIELLLRQVKITELALDEVNKTFNEDDYAALAPGKQAWSAVMWAAREMLDVHRQMQAGLEN